MKAELAQMLEIFFRYDRWIGFGVLALIALTLLEIVYDALLTKPRDYRDSMANLVIGAVFEFCYFTPVVLTLAIGLVELGARLPWHIPTNPATAVLNLLAVDFCYYWSHRIEHSWKPLWATHHVHHSSRDFNLTTAHRLQFTLPFFAWLRIFPVILLGFDPILTLLFFHLLIVGQIPLHTRHVGRLGWLEKILNTPSNHRVHHWSDPAHLNRNLGGIFIIWDRIFGTWAPEDREIVYGSHDGFSSHNPLSITFHQPLALLRGVMLRKGFLGRLCWLLSLTSEETHEEAREETA